VAPLAQNTTGPHLITGLYTTLMNENFVMPLVGQKMLVKGFLGNKSLNIAVAGHFLLLILHAFL